MALTMLKTREWKKELEQILESSPNRMPAEVINEIRDIGSVMGPDAGTALLNACPELLENRAALRKAYHEYAIANEVLQTRQILQQDWDGQVSFVEVANSLSWRIYNRSVDMFEHLEFHGCHRMVLVGCGWMPATLYHVHDKTEVPELVGLDVVPEAVATANELSKHLGYARVRCEIQDGRLYDYSAAQIVYVVGMVSEMKPAILSRIATTAPDNVQVVINEPYSLGLLWEEPALANLDSRFEVTGKGPDWYADRTPVTGVGLGRVALSRDVYLRLRAD
jgi:hypothetical protein